MTVDLSADLSKRRSLTVRRASAALFALAVSIAVPFTPARALVPAAPAWAHSAEINQLVIKVETAWDQQKARRQRRERNPLYSGRGSIGSGIAGTQCTSFKDERTCKRERGCKWQTASIIPKRNPGYCYAEGGGKKPLLGGPKPR